MTDKTALTLVVELETTLNAKVAALKAQVVEDPGKTEFNGALIEGFGGVIAELGVIKEKLV